MVFNNALNNGTEIPASSFYERQRQGERYIKVQGQTSTDISLSGSPIGNSEATAAWNSHFQIVNSCQAFDLISTSFNNLRLDSNGTERPL